ncbi:MAG: argininosuccinate lyase, partial [Clostridia bacterium]|nr:argininosuccinate lyase [Clostridia bacterium]
MEKIWTGRTDGATNKIADDFNSSVKFDKRLYREDIAGSIAHVKMLSKQGIVSEKDAETLTTALEGILNDIESGELAIDEKAEDIHTFVETVLTIRTGEVGKKLHTARSRNDQVALDMKSYVKKEIDVVIAKLKTLIIAVTDKAEEYK